MENTKKTYVVVRSVEFWPTFDIQISKLLLHFRKNFKTSLFRKPTEVSQNTPTFILREVSIKK